jgi:hypothetical protein
MTSPPHGPPPDPPLAGAPRPAPLPEPWLRGPVPGVPAPLQPVAHALLGALEDVERAAGDLNAAETWARPAGAASIGFHLRHLCGATDRLVTYAAGRVLDEAQRSFLKSEGTPGEPQESAAPLVAAFRATVERVIDDLRAWPVESLAEVGGVGRAQLPATVLGLLFHAAEHAARHAGQVVATARVVRGGP